VIEATKIVSAGEGQLRVPFSLFSATEVRFGEGLPLGLKDRYAAITLYGEILDDVT